MDELINSATQSFPMSFQSALSQALPIFRGILEQTSLFASPSASEPMRRLGESSISPFVMSEIVRDIARHCGITGEQRCVEKSGAPYFLFRSGSTLFVVCSTRKQGGFPNHHARYRSELARLNGLYPPERWTGQLSMFQPPRIHEREILTSIFPTQLFAILSFGPSARNPSFWQVGFPAPDLKSYLYLIPPSCFCVGTADEEPASPIIREIVERRLLANADSPNADSLTDEEPPTPLLR